MARETKVGLLVGLGFIVCFAVILENRGRQDRVAPVLPHELLANARLELVPSPAEVEDRVRRSITAPQNTAQPLDSSEAKVTTVSYTPQGERFVADRSEFGATRTSTTTLATNKEPAAAESGHDGAGFSLPVFKGVYSDDDNADNAGDDGHADDGQEPENAPGLPTEEPDVRVAFARNFEPSNVLTATSAAKTNDGSQGDRSRHAAPAKTEPSASERIHTVVSGDSLSRIAQEYYGSRAKQIIDEIFKANSDKMKSPDELMVGQRVMLPVIDGRQFVSAAVATQQQTRLARTDDAPKAASQTTAAKKASSPPAEKRSETKERYYQVQPGDRYATIARDKLGDASRWKEIAELNRDIFPDPQRIRYGVRIRLPKEESASSTGSKS